MGSSAQFVGGFGGLAFRGWTERRQNQGNNDDEAASLDATENLGGLDRPSGSKL